MYWDDYFLFMIAILVCGIISAVASANVKSTYSKYSKAANLSGLTGYDVARRLIFSNNVQGIGIGRVKGQLSDHYNPTKAIVNLSEDVYDRSSVASVAVAAHEMGHVMQKQEGYWFYNVRTALVPVVNFGTFLAMPLVLVGLLLDVYLQAASDGTGFFVAMIGVALYGGSLLFSIVTLPVELDASRRAKQMLVSEGILMGDEIDGASKVLSAAAFTYVASVLTSLVYFLRFLVRVLTIFGRRDD